MPNASKTLNSNQRPISIFFAAESPRLRNSTFATKKKSFYHEALKKRLDKATGITLDATSSFANVTNSVSNEIPIEQSEIEAMHAQESTQEQHKEHTAPRIESTHNDENDLNYNNFRLQSKEASSSNDLDNGEVIIMEESPEAPTQMQLNLLHHQLKEANQRALNAETKLATSEKTNVLIMNELVKVNQKYSSLKEMVGSRNAGNVLDIQDESSLYVLPLQSSYDQKFLRAAVKFAFRDEPEILSNLYLSSRKKLPEVHVISDELCFQFKNMYSRRLRKCKLTEIQYNVRMDKFKTLLKNALFNIRDECKKSN